MNDIMTRKGHTVDDQGKADTLYFWHELLTVAVLRCCYK